MKLDEYREGAMSTCMDTCHNFAYMTYGLVGEVGEFASKVAKGIRKGSYRTSGNGFESTEDRPEMNNMREALTLELGDILWLVAGLADVMGLTLEEVAGANLAKLRERKKAGTIDGDGDGISGKDRRASI